MGILNLCCLQCITLVFFWYYVSINFFFFIKMICVIGIGWNLTGLISTFFIYHHFGSLADNSPILLNLGPRW